MTVLLRMSLLVDNPITRALSTLIEEFKLATHLTEDLYDYVFGHNNTDRLQKLLYLAGIYYLANKVGKTIYSTYKNWGWLTKHYTYARKFNGDEFRNRYGGEEAWALVTGFSSGIGFAYACELAKMGFNLVLVDWHAERAKASERWIKQRNDKICTKVVILDLTSTPSTIRTTLEAETSDVDIGLVINNAGMATPGRYQNIEQLKLIMTLKLNLMAVVEVTRTFLPLMRKRYNRSGIINIASGLAEFPSPFTGVYSATKRFVKVFTNTLYLENTDKIDVLCVKPLGVLTGMMEFRKTVFAMILPVQVVRQSLMELGEVNQTFGAVEHKVLSSSMKSLSRAGLFDLYSKEFIRADKI